MTPAHKTSRMRHVIQVTHNNGRVFTFSHDQDSPLTFWRIASGGREWRSFVRVVGNELPSFFLAVAILVETRGYLTRDAAE